MATGGFILDRTAAMEFPARVGADRLSRFQTHDSADRISTHRSSLDRRRQSRNVALHRRQVNSVSAPDVNPELFCSAAKEEQSMRCPMTSSFNKT